MTAKFKIGDVAIFRNYLYTLLTGKMVRIINVYEQDQDYGVEFIDDRCNNDQFELKRKRILVHEHELANVVDVPTQRS